MAEAYPYVARRSVRRDTYRPAIPPYDRHRGERRPRHPPPKAKYAPRFKVASFASTNSDRAEYQSGAAHR